MSERVIRNCVLQDRLARGLSEYYSRRIRGVYCPDLLPPDERESSNRRYDERLQHARRFMQSSRMQMTAAL